MYSNLHCYYNIGLSVAALVADKCASSPCQNGGNCVSEAVDKYTCICPDGFSGPTCDQCPEICLNSTKCEVTQSGYNCMCHPGYTGNTCSVEINQCESAPCGNGGSCMNRENAFLCNCLEGFTGSVCETEIDSCLSTPCREGAVCVRQMSGYICVCISEENEVTNCDTGQS